MSTVSKVKKDRCLWVLRGIPESVSDQSAHTGITVILAKLDPSEKVKMKHDIHGTPAENLQRLITDCGVSPHKVHIIP